VKTKKKKVAPAKKKSAKGSAKVKVAASRSTPAAKKAAPKAKTKPKATKKVSPKARAKAKAATSPKAKPKPTAGVKKWLDFVEKHGVVLASAKGPVPSLAEQIAGEPIIGSWWSHAKGKEIFEVLSAVDEDVDVRCFKLVDGKVTFVHRRVWPALVRLARDGVFAAARVESVHQEHTETGVHRNFNVPFPEWVPDDVAKAADAMTTDSARAELGTWTASA
jgi:hypothetical protein